MHIFLHARSRRQVMENIYTACKVSKRKVSYGFFIFSKPLNYAYCIWCLSDKCVLLGLCACSLTVINDKLCILCGLPTSTSISFTHLVCATFQEAVRAPHFWQESGVRAPVWQHICAQLSLQTLHNTFTTCMTFHFHDVHPQASREPQTTPGLLPPAYNPPQAWIE